MGMKGKEITSNALAVQLDAQGKVKYDLIARQGHGKDKVNFTLFYWVSQKTWFDFLNQNQYSDNIRAPVPWNGILSNEAEK